MRRWKCDKLKITGELKGKKRREMAQRKRRQMKRSETPNNVQRREMISNTHREGT